MGWEHEISEKPCFCGKGKIQVRFSSDDFLHSEHVEFMLCVDCKKEWIFLEGTVARSGFWTRRTK